MNKLLNNVDAYYNKMKNSIADKIDIDKDYNYQIDHNIINVMHDNKIVLKAKFTFLGSYNIINSIWYWGWNMDIVNKELTKKLDVLKDFVDEIKNNKYKFNTLQQQNLFFRFNSGYFYTNIKNINNLSKLVLYLCKSIWVISVPYDKNGNIINKKNKSKLMKFNYLLIDEIVQIKK